MVSNSNEKCVKKINKLVFTEPEGEKQNRKPPCKTSKPTLRPSVCRMEPKQIRMCSRADMKKLVPPKICSCKQASLKGGGGMGAFLFFGLKAALAAGAIYVSYDLGVWGTTDQTQEMYRTFCAARTSPQKRKNEKWSPPSCEAERSLHHVSPFNQFSHCDDTPFNLEKNGIKWGSYWNFGVEQLFNALAGLPYNVTNKIREIRGDKKEKLEEVSCIPYSELPENEKVVNTYK